MKKLANLKGAKALNKGQQKSISGGNGSGCKIENCPPQHYLDWRCVCVPE